MPPPHGRRLDRHRWEGARLARHRHPCPAGAPHSPPASARGPRAHRRHHLRAPGHFRQRAPPRSRPPPTPPPTPRLAPPPNLRHSPLHRLAGCSGTESREGWAGWRATLLPLAPRGPSAALPARPAPPSPRRCDSLLHGLGIPSPLGSPLSASFLSLPGLTLCCLIVCLSVSSSIFVSLDGSLNPSAFYFTQFLHVSPIYFMPPSFLYPSH